MITILNRIFPNDISEYIYNFVLYDYLNGTLIGKIIMIELMMEKINTTFYDNCVYNLNYSEFNHVYNMINKINENVVKMNYYKFDCDFISVLNEYIRKIENNNKYENKAFMKTDIDKKIKILKKIF